MKKIQSHNSQYLSSLKELLFPSPVQAFLYLLTSSLALSVFNARAFWSYLSSDPVGKKTAASLFINGSQAGGSIWTKISQGRISLIIFWVIVGAIIYTVVWFLKNIFINIQNDIIADAFVHPKSYNRARYWESVLIRKVYFGGATVVLLGYIYAAVKLLPLFSSMFFAAIYNFGPVNLVSLISVVVVLSLLLHLFVVLIHMTISSWRFIFTDL